MIKDKVIALVRQYIVTNEITTYDELAEKIITLFPKSKIVEKEVVKYIEREPEPEPSMSFVDFIKKKDLKNPTRKKETVLLRNYMMYMIRKNTKLSTPLIGSFFNKDHSIVLYACKRTEEQLSTNDYSLRNIIFDHSKDLNNINWKL